MNLEVVDSFSYLSDYIEQKGCFGATDRLQSVWKDFIACCHNWETVRLQLKYAYHAWICSVFLFASETGAVKV